MMVMLVKKCCLVGVVGCLSCLLVGCDFLERTAETPRQNEIDLDSLVNTLPTNELVLADLDATKTDSLVETLIPFLLADPSTRTLENWYNLRSQWEEAYGNSENILYYTNLAYHRFLREGEVANAAMAKYAAGRIEYLSANYTEATEYYQPAFELAQGIGDSVIMGWVLINLAGPYIHSKDFLTAESFISRAITMGENINNAGIVALGKMNLGTLYHMKGKPDTAMLLLEQGRQISREHQLPGFEVMISLNIAFAFFAGGEIDKAINLLREIKIKDGQEASISNIILHLNLAEAYLGKKDFDQAIHYLNIGCELSYSINYGYGIYHCLKDKVDYFEAIGDYEAALEQFRDFHAIAEEQTGAKANQQLQSLANKQKISDRDFQIELLRKEEAANQLAETMRRRRYLQYLFLVGVVMLGIFAIMRARHRTKLAYQRKTIAETKLQVLQSQMNPHFIYNAMSGIQNYILKSEKIEAYSYLGKFAALLRQITKYSANVYIELEEEIKLIKTYLELEKLRFRDQFVYDFDVEESLLDKNLDVPSMMIQPVVENALIHGLSGLDRQGRLLVQLKQHENGVICVIKDNGRGRKTAGKISREQAGQHLSIASVNIAQRVDFLRKIGYEKAEITIEDLYQDGRPAGTRATIYLPFMKKESY